MRSEGAALGAASRQKLPLKVRIKPSTVSVFGSLPVGIFGAGTLKDEMCVNLRVCTGER